MIDCTVLFPHVNSAKISPNGKFICENDEKGITIRNTETFLVEEKFVLPWKDDKIKWSPDSSLICCWFDFT